MYILCVGVYFGMLICIRMYVCVCMHACICAYVCMFKYVHMQGLTYLSARLGVQF